MNERVQEHLVAWEPIAAGACFAVAVIAIALGFVFTTHWLLDDRVHPILHTLGLVLLIVGIPIMMLGAHFMDVQEKKLDESRKNSKSVHVVGLVIGIVFIPSASVNAQQAIFNVPSTDVLDKGKVYAELDASLKPTDAKFSSFVPRVVIGAGSNIEFGLNVTGNIQPGPDSTTLVPTIKWRPFQGENGWTIVLGNNLFVPVRNRAYNAANYFYAETSKTFKNGTRITFGGYDFTKNAVALANRAGGQFGFEQPLNRKITFAADWFTGKHASGYFTPGIIFKAGPRVTGYAGYSIGNQNVSGGNHFFLLELGYNFD
jgi:uncharacterized membrane protein YidH (DUF202 family)